MAPLYFVDKNCEINLLIIYSHFVFKSVAELLKRLAKYVILSV